MILKQPIASLKLDTDIVRLLSEKKIEFIKDLWLKDREDLKSMSLSDCQIKQIIIKLQLLGFDLNKKIY